MGPLQRGRLRGRGSVPCYCLFSQLWELDTHRVNDQFRLHLGLASHVARETQGTSHPTSTRAVALAAAHTPRSFFPSSCAPRASIILTEVEPAGEKRGLA